MPAGNLLNKDKLLGGLKGGDRRRATVALSLIEAKAASLTLAHRTVRAPFLTESALAEHNRAYLSAIAISARSSHTVSEQDLEREVAAWRALVPNKPEIRAELIRLILGKYRFNRRRMPAMAAALGFDDPAVQAAFNADADQPLTSALDSRLSAVEHLRWSWFSLSSRLENLPPFWTAFALTLTETVGAGTLALPIAFATIGPLAGVVLLLILGLINLLTVAYLAEASARNVSIRYGSAFVGRLVTDFLGRPASILLRLSLFGFCCIILASYYTGFASTLAAVTGVPAPLWVALVCGVVVYLIMRKSLLGTLASALVVGFINISILVLLSLLALRHATPENLAYINVPLLQGNEFEAAHIKLVFGVVLVSYFGHLSVSNCAQTVLSRDPGGRSLKLGTVAAMIVAIAVYCLWSLSVAGAVGSENLRYETGTALVPLAAQLGPQVYLLGGIFAVLGLGMSAVHFGLGIFNMAQELMLHVNARKSQLRLPRQAATIAALLPILCVFAYVEWSYLYGTPSFTAPLEFVGAMFTPVLAGVLPVALLLASRAQGLPMQGARVAAALSNNALLVFIVGLSFAGLLLHGLVLWQDPMYKAAAIVMAVAVLCVLLDLIRRRVFAPAVQLDLRYFPEDGHRAILAIADNGKQLNSDQLVATAQISYQNGSNTPWLPGATIDQFHRCKSIHITLSGVTACQTVLIALQISDESQATPLAGNLTMHQATPDTPTLQQQFDATSGITKNHLTQPASNIELHFEIF